MSLYSKYDSVHNFSTCDTAILFLQNLPLWIYHNTIDQVVNKGSINTEKFSSITLQLYQYDMIQ